MRLAAAILRRFRGARAAPRPDPLVAARLERERQDMMDRIFGPDPDRHPRQPVDPGRPATAPAHQAATVVAVKCLAFCEVHPPGHWDCRKARAKPLGHQRPDDGNNAHACASVIYGW